MNRGKAKREKRAQAKALKLGLPPLARTYRELQRNEGFRAHPMFKPKEAPSGPAARPGRV